MKYKTIKFKNGEVITGGVDDKLNSENFHSYDIIHVKDPVQYSTFKFLNNFGQVVETVSMAPFMPTSSDQEVLIATDSILAVCNVRPGALDRYLAYMDALHDEQAGKLDKQTKSTPDVEIASAEDIWDAMEEAAISKLH
jgi:hypothetical protein